MRVNAICILAFCLCATGCVSSGTVSMVTTGEDVPARVATGAVAFDELGEVEGQACRHFVLAVIPWGAADFRAAIDDALSKAGGDALVNVTVESALYGLFPIYNVYSITCTTVRGTAVKIR